MLRTRILTAVVLAPPFLLAVWLGGVVLAALLAIVLRLLAPFLGVIVLGAVAAGLLTPSYRRLVEAVGGRRHLAAILICLLLLVALLVPMFFTAREVSKEALAYYESLPAETATDDTWRSRGVALSNIGDVFFATGDLEAAGRSYWESLQIARRLAERDRRNAGRQRDVLAEIA